MYTVQRCPIAARPLLRPTFAHRISALAWVAMIAWLSTAPAADAQSIDLDDRPIADVRVQGLDRVPQQLVLNQIRLRKGMPYDAQVVQEDIVRITQLGRFVSVQAQVEPQKDGAIVLTYVVTEQPLLSDIKITGNKALSEQELLALMLLRPGDPIDQYLIHRGIKQIKQAYKKAGYFATNVSMDPETLDQSNTLSLKVREGPLVRIRQIKFTGNKAFTAKQLHSKIRSKAYVFILRKGELNREQLDADTASLRVFYQDSGYLDAQIGRRIILSPDQKDAAVEFFIDEGRIYAIGSVRVEGNRIFSQQQIIEAMLIKVGDVFSSERVRRSNQAVTDMYGKLGFIEARLQIDRLFHEKQPKVDLVLKIDEGLPYIVGTVSVRGNQLTQDKVIYREIRGLVPGRRFDRERLRLTEERLEASSLFSQAKITVLGTAQDITRDVLVEVKEANTGSLSFGAGISSDAGLLGAIDLTQRNFDITDLPESIGEFFTGKAFRGAGQYFALSLQPGNQFSRYSVSLREPHIFESDYSFDTNLFFFNREREDWDEQRSGGSLGLGHRFGDVWSVGLRFRAETIELTNIDPSAPVDVFAVQGDSTISSVGIVVSRSTVDSRFFPTHGSRLQLELTRAGALGGDYNFTKLNVEFKKFWTLDEDFFGRKTILSARVEVGYIFEDNESPIFERFYAGGHRSFRGFRFRGIGPRGIRNDTMTIGDDPIGGDWLFLAGVEYGYPIYKDVVRGVVFLDSGTVRKKFGFKQYRVAIGAGLRLKIPFLGQAPFALDFAIPINDEPGDESQAISFDLALPF